MQVRRVHPKEDITGRKFGRLTVLRQSERRNKKYRIWVCKCDCAAGGEVERKVTHLLNHNAGCSGCFEERKKFNKTHGMSSNKERQNRLYNIWHSMKKRCYTQSDRDYPRYGGKGIKVAQDWHDFEKFHAWAVSNGYENTLTIERCDPSGNYEPSNCEWITLRKNVQNMWEHRRPRDRQRKENECILAIMGFAC